MKSYEEGHRRVILMAIENSIGLQRGHALVHILCLLLAGEHGDWLLPIVDVLLLVGVMSLYVTWNRFHFNEDQNFSA